MSIYSNLYIKFSKQKGLPVRNSPFYSVLSFQNHYRLNHVRRFIFHNLKRFGKLIPAFVYMGGKKAYVQFSCRHKGAQLFHTESAAGHKSANDGFMPHAYPPFHTGGYGYCRRFPDSSTEPIFSARLQCFHCGRKCIHRTARDNDTIHTFAVGESA